MGMAWPWHPFKLCGLDMSMIGSPGIPGHHGSALLIEIIQVSTGLASNKEEDALAKLSGEEREALTEKIETLTSMGFSDDVAISALLQCDGDVDSALDHLLEN
ncbi:hypothetical protein CYMTET_11157 [Cymbomonas tetramitiformis]|uniref:UBA domain-containing protein n=1 Tax=Cymbomonas tetramitiformis TaxID=36881 RepID=A0AAE0GMU7_9CHLO|nr:hypothetical protein CYMTET_11157 [Cymbomonas tetramitiformis]